MPQEITSGWTHWAGNKTQAHRGGGEQDTGSQGGARHRLTGGSKTQAHRGGGGGGGQDTGSQREMAGLYIRARLRVRHGEPFYGL